MSKYPVRIYAAPEGQFGQGFDAITMAPWNERPTYEDEQVYVRADVVAGLVRALQMARDCIDPNGGNLPPFTFSTIDSALSKAGGL